MAALNVNFPFQFDGRGRTRSRPPRTTSHRSSSRCCSPRRASASICPTSAAACCNCRLRRTAWKWPPPRNSRCRARCRNGWPGSSRCKSVVASAQDNVLSVTVELYAPQHRRDPGADLRPGRANMIYSCCNENRKNSVRTSATLNGIDFLEVADAGASVQGQPTLLVHFLNAYGLTNLVQQKDQVVIEGGESITALKVVSVSFAANSQNIVAVATDRLGDFSRVCSAPAASGPHVLTADLAGADMDRSAARRSIVLFQIAMRDPRLRPAGSDLPAADAGAAADQLSCQGLWQLPLDHARPHQSACAELGRARDRGGFRRRPDGADRLRRRSAQLPARRDRHRGLPRDRTQPGVTAAPCPARRLSRTRRLQRPGLDSAQRRRQTWGSAVPRPYAGSILHRTRPACLRTSGLARTTKRRPLPAACRFSSQWSMRCFIPSTAKCTSTPGATTTVACRAGPPRRR